MFLTLCHQDPTVVHLNPVVKIFGDIHGQLNDLNDFFRRYCKPIQPGGDIHYAEYTNKQCLFDGRLLTFKCILVTSSLETMSIEANTRLK